MEPPGDHPPGPVCPYCKAPRITSAAEPCYKCGRALTLYLGALPGLLPREEITLANNPLWCVLGTFYLFFLGLATLMLVQFPAVMIIMTLLAVPPLVSSLYQFRQRDQAGRPITVWEWLVLFLAHLGLIGAAALLVMCLIALGCFVDFGIW